MITFDKKLFKNYKEVIAILTFLGSAFGYFSSNTCGSLSLKLLLIALLAISYFFFCLVIYRNTRGAKLTLVTLIIGCIILFIILSIIVYTKKCPLENSTQINIDNSRYNDHSSHYNINKLPQRVFNDGDFLELKSQLKDKNSKVIVQYLKNNLEDTLMCKEIISTLNQMGFYNVARSEATTLPNDLASGRMTIRQEFIDADTLYKVIINPQQ